MPTPTDRNDKGGAPAPANRPTNAKNPPPRGSRDKKPGREDRLAEALRANLRRRKAGGKKEDKDA
jgi:hypothetical protein